MNYSLIAPHISSVCSIHSVDASTITAYHVHEGGMASRVGSRSRRFLCTGHANGQVQVKSQ